MAERVIIQTQSEYASMNRAYIKLLFFVGTFIVGVILLTGGWGFVSHLWGIILLLPAIIWIIFKINKRVKKKHKKLFFIILGLILLLIFAYFLLPRFSLDKNKDNSNKNLDSIIRKFNGTDWNSQGDNSPIVKSFCEDVCSPSKLNSYGIGGYVKSISCNCGNIDMFKGTAQGVADYIFTYENNILKQISLQEYSQRLADYHKNNP